MGDRAGLLCAGHPRHIAPRALILLQRLSAPWACGTLAYLFHFGAPVGCEAPVRLHLRLLPTVWVQAPQLPHPLRPLGLYVVGGHGSIVVLRRVCRGCVPGAHGIRLQVGGSLARDRIVPGSRLL